MKKDQISHTGKILEITPETTTVEITVSSACASCHAKGMCGVSEEKEKVIVLPTDPYASYEVGDEVYVMLKKSM
ncbi:MAG: SoxR reducing system RseC family protein, partial [Candidatus Cryptobacteroides sp.]